MTTRQLDDPFGVGLDGSLGQLAQGEIIDKQLPERPARSGRGGGGRHHRAGLRVGGRVKVCVENVC